MHFTLRAAAALLIGACAPAALVAPTFAQTCACSTGGSYVIQADEAPPPLPEYDQPPLPAPGYYWTPGYWAWNNVDYYWVPGVWVEPPQPGLLWTPSYWGFVGGVYAFRPGYWGPHIGFYGGVNYGFGYTGRGYEGGRWQGQNFFYNTAVNNIRSTRVTNVYNSPVVVNNVTINRVSYNGGQGGVAAAPTPQESLAASEPHVPPTQLQRNQIRAASIEPRQFRSANQGKPAVAAMPRPGAFNAKDAVPAKAAGTAQVAPQPGQNAQPPAPGEQKLPPGAKPPAAGQAPAVQAPPAAAPKPEEKLPAAEKPIKPEPAPIAAPPKPQPAPAPIAAPPKLQPPPPKPAPPPPAVERRPPPPAVRRAPECGRPGQPPCPK